MDPARPTTERDWHGFACLLLITAAGLLTVYLALAVVIDPYDTGRSGLFARGAVRPQGPRTASAVRGRDPAFTGAVIGNSHIQLVEPAALTRLTGIPFVQLAVPATGPMEQFALLAWFLHHHPRPEAIVLSADAFWCADDPAFPSAHAFPYWLLSDWPAYLRGLARFSAAQETVNRIGWLLDPRRAHAPPDGWWDYEADYLRLGFGLDPVRRAALEKPADPEAEAHRGGPFPAAARLRAELDRVPAATPVVLVFPPVYAGAEAPQGSARARAEAACRGAIRDVIAARPLSAVVDGHDGRSELSDPKQFFDRSHYRLSLARVLTQEIAAVLAGLRARRPD